jgi:hypothetical protein
MIHAFTNTGFIAYVQTEDTRIDTTASTSNIRHLVKFTNDMSGAVQYAYANVENIFNRYTSLEFLYNATPDVYVGKVDLKPAGYWKYEVYEVVWASLGSLDNKTAPSTELAVLTPASSTKGVVKGLVTKGKMLVSEQAGTEEVQYVQNGGEVISLNIATGGLGYSSAPVVTITGDCITPATATCTVSGGVVNSVTIVNAGNGYTSDPVVTLSNVGETTTASITASIQENNYIYNG